MHAREHIRRAERAAPLWAVDKSCPKTRKLPWRGWQLFVWKLTRGNAPKTKILKKMRFWAPTDTESWSQAAGGGSSQVQRSRVNCSWPQHPQQRLSTAPQRSVMSRASAPAAGGMRCAAAMLASVRRCRRKLDPSGALRLGFASVVNSLGGGRSQPKRGAGSGLRCGRGGQGPPQGRGAQRTAPRRTAPQRNPAAAARA